MQHSHKKSASPRFEMWSRKAGFSDLSKDPEAQQIVCAALRRIFDADLSKLTIKGNLDLKGYSSLRIALHRHGRVWRAVNLECVYPGLVIVEAAGDMADAIRRDLEGLVSEAWLPALGLPGDLPSHFEFSVSRCGQVDLRLIPAF